MKKDIEKIIKIPEGVDVEIKGGQIIVKSGGKEMKKELCLPNIKIEKDKDLKISSKKATKREAKLIGTFASHIKNMIDGLKKEFVYKLEICNVHFPMSVKVEEDKLVIKNFLGEKVDRTAKILSDVKVEVNGNEIIASSTNKNSAGQTAANIEKTTKIKSKDRRVFQDGIYITEKPCKRE